MLILYLDLLKLEHKVLINWQISIIHLLTIFMLSKKRSNSTSIDELSDDSIEEKSCRLCRKILSSDHFFNPKTGALFAVCDICRKRKRDKYWSIYVAVYLLSENKETMRQSLLEASYLSKPKYTSYRRNRSVSITDKAEDVSASSQFDSPEVHFSDGSFPKTSVNTSFMCDKSSFSSSIPSQGNLIVIPPQFSSFIRSNIHNPTYIRQVIGEYYWNELCLNDICKSI